MKSQISKKGRKRGAGAYTAKVVLSPPPPLSRVQGPQRERTPFGASAPGLMAPDPQGPEERGCSVQVSNLLSIGKPTLLHFMTANHTQNVILSFCWKVFPQP